MGSGAATDGEQAVREVPLEPGFQLEWVASATSSAAFLASVAASPESWVRESVASHEHTPPETLAAMAPDRFDTVVDARLLQLLAANPRTPVEALAVIAELVQAAFRRRVDRRVHDAGIALFERPDTPDDVLLALLDDPNAPTDLRLVAASVTTRSHALDRLRADANDRVRRAAARNSFRPLSTENLTGPGGLVDRAVRTRRSTTGSIFDEHFVGPLADVLANADDDTYLASLDAVALDIARTYDEGTLTFWDADQLITGVWAHMVSSRRNRPFADIAIAVHEAFDAGEYHHGDGLDPASAYTDSEIRRILDTTVS